MLVKDMFVKPIDRDVKGVVKIGQDDDRNVRQELEEYVVTAELQKHFRDFFSAYAKSIRGDTDKMGVWISGFFGSGKSHLLKILSYLIENREIDGKHAIDYFVEDNKVLDPMVLADMKLANTVNTDAILFNIDSRSDTSGSKSKDAIVKVFLKVFNEMQGYYGNNPYIADLERELDHKGKYDLFQLKYQEITGDSWLDTRNKFIFRKGKVVQTLIAIGFMDKYSAESWAESTKKEYAISIKDFALLVSDYITAKGNNHHVVFFVDEMGQYISDDKDLILNLQTVTEDLGTYCEGKAWIVVTSQSAIDSITDVSGEDFSKIQGRFDTRLNLTSADASEVIKKRILEKTTAATETLKAVYESKESVIQNLIVFNDGIEKKKYVNATDFAETYPYIPYQFNLLGSTLTSIRTHGSSGKHLSEGERTMLALTKECAEEIKYEEDGVLVSYDNFYDRLDQYLDHNHAIVVIHAQRNEYINPKNETNCFNVSVLKVLFLIKYVKEVEANVDNITTLMINHIDTDRIALKQKVQEALDILVQQTLVQKNGDIYIFLTDTEQEVERQIKNQQVESSELAKNVWSEIFEGIFTDKKYKYPEHNGRYTFGYDQIVDDYLFGKTGNNIKVKVFTPRSHDNNNEEQMLMGSYQEDAVYVSLPPNDTFINEMSQAIRIDKYLASSEAQSMPNIEEIKAHKNKERINHQNRASRTLEQALNKADFYVYGNKMTARNLDFNSALTEALGKVVKQVYSRLHYITAAKNEGDVRDLFNRDIRSNIALEGISLRDNEPALNELIEYISSKTDQFTKISLQEIMNRFTAAPYGFLEVDIRWLVAKLFTEGSLELTLSGNPLSLMNSTGEEIGGIILNKAYLEKLLLSVKEAVDPAQISALKNISKAVFKNELTTDDTDEMVIKFNKSADKMKQEINELLLEYRYKPGIYPGKTLLEEGVNLLNQTLMMNKSGDVFEYVAKHQDDYRKLEENYRPVKTFFSGTQREIWEKAVSNYRIYDESKNYFKDNKLAQTMDSMGEILNMDYPYDHIKDLPPLNQDFLDRYSSVLEEISRPVESYIEQRKADVLAYLGQFYFADGFGSDYKKTFAGLKDKAKTSHDVKEVSSYRVEADLLYERYIDDINDEWEKRNPSDNIKPEVIVKKKTRLSSLMNESSIELKSEDDVDRFADELSSRLKKELDKNQILTIDL